MVENLSRVAGIGAGQHRQRVPTHRGDGADVGRDAGSAAGVAGVEHHDTCRACVVFVEILRRVRVGKGGIGGGRCHGGPFREWQIMMAACIGYRVNLFYVNSRAGGPPRGVSMDTIIDNLFEGHVSCDRFQNLDVFDLWMDL